MPASSLRNDLVAMIAGWRAEIADLERKIAACEEALRLYDESPSVSASANADIAIIEGCRTQREALRAIAAHNDGILRAREAAQIIHDAGMARGKLTSAVSTVHNLLNSGEEWERVAPGTFRYLAETEDP